MVKQRKKRSIAIPVKTIFNEEGSNYFLKRQQHLNRFETPSGGSEYGLVFEDFMPKTIQKMLKLEYISRLELSFHEASSKREELIDLSKLVAYGMLYRQFSTDIFKIILQSDLIIRWNRANPKQVIDEKTQLKSSLIRKALQGKENEIERVKKQIINEVVRDYDAVFSSPSSPEGSKRILTAKEFLDSLSPFSWFFLITYHSTRAFESIISRTKELLVEYIHKTALPEYLALVLIELLQKTETENLKRAAEELYGSTVDPVQLMAQHEKRLLLNNYVAQNDMRFSQSYHFEKRLGLNGQQHRLRITIYNKESEYRQMNELIYRKAHARTQDTSLFDYYTENAGHSLESDLGFYYLSYLKEACKSHGIRFDSFVNQISEGDFTVIHLIMDF